MGTATSIRYPRVLLVNGEPLNSRSATGITLSNLFRLWPSSHIAQVYSSSLRPDSPDLGLHVRLSPNDLIPFAWLRRRARASNTTSGNIGHEAGRASVRRRLSPLLDLLPYSVHQNDLALLHAFQPEVIYTTLGSIRIARLVNYLAAEFNIPVVPHFMDDWLSTYSVPGMSIGSDVHRRLLNSLVGKTFERAPFGLSIGDDMAAEYKERFGKSFHPFMNTVEVPQACPKRRDSATLRMVYMGGLHLGRGESLSMVAKALGEAAPKHATLDMYVPEKDAEVARRISTPHMRFVRSAKAEEVSDLLQKYDAAVHVESFDPHATRYTRLSVSTKIPQYFSYGLPVLAYGPREIASIKYVVRSKAGIAAGSPEELNLAIKQFSSSDDAIKEMAHHAWLTATDRHDAPKVRDKFKALLTSAAESCAKV